LPNLKGDIVCLVFLFQFYLPESVGTVAAGTEAAGIVAADKLPVVADKQLVAVDK